MKFWDQYQGEITSALKHSQAEIHGETSTVDQALEIACKWSTECSEKFFIGNGASAAMASHMSADWSKLGGIRSSCFTDPALMTATANDFSFPEIFQIHVEKWAKPGDVLISVSSSGQSENVVKAAVAARARDIKVISFTGFKSENPSRSNADLSFYVPSSSYGIVECVHQILLHAWLDLFVEKRASTE